MLPTQSAADIHCGRDQGGKTFPGPIISRSGWCGLPCPIPMSLSRIRDSKLLQWQSLASFKESSVDQWITAARTTGYRSAELARLLQVSPRQLQRYTRQELGCPPQQFLNHLRLRDAQSLLVKSESVKWTAIQLGFKQVSHFCRVFKRYAGMTPGEYRIRARRHPDTPSMPSGSKDQCGAAELCLSRLTQNWTDAHTEARD